MKYYLYILGNDAGRHYIGISATISERLKAHNRGEVRSTRYYRPWHVIHEETYENRIQARTREVELKGSYTKRESLFKK